MAKSRRQSGRHRATQRNKRKGSAATSTAIPVVVGVVVVVVAAGLLLSLAGWHSSPAESAANPTALPMATRQIPYPDVPRISIREAHDRLARGEIVMVDVRSKASYDALHIEGAISLPESEIEDRLDELDPGNTIVLYCT